jgi:hypothetical protein
MRVHICEPLWVGWFSGLTSNTFGARRVCPGAGSFIRGKATFFAVLKVD